MTVLSIVRAAALGAAAMYMLDPDRGRRRRAVARDRTRSALTQSGEFLHAARSDAQARWQGVRALARRLRSDDRLADDRVLAERVRARLGRVVAHPHAVQVIAEQGHVRLKGPILSWEHTPLMVAVRLVRGVRSVDDSGLVLHDSSEGIPALQGTGRRPGLQVLDSSWTPAVRLLAIGGGGALALYGLACSGLARVVFSGAGLALVTRGGFNAPLRELAQSGTAWTNGTFARRAVTNRAADTSGASTRSEPAETGTESTHRRTNGVQGGRPSPRPNGNLSNQYVQQGGEGAQRSAGGSSGSTQQAGGSASSGSTRQAGGSASPTSTQQAGGGAGSSQATQYASGSSATQPSGVATGTQRAAGSAMSPQQPGLGAIPQSQQQQALSGGRCIVEPGAGSQYAYPDTAQEKMSAWSMRQPGAIT